MSPTRAPRSTAQGSVPSPPVKDGEAPWTAAELAAIRAGLEADIETLRGEIDVAEHEVVELMRHSGDGAGDDQADAGSKTLEREQELSLANNARELLVQSTRAIERLEDGTYGTCENCGNAIGKLRLEAAPRATLCLPCKSKEERR
ncbi:MAG: TraR/DksA C4-type zinc finger protein [Tetrasphaera jenkinsii]|uniref:Putative DNA-binding protein n=1 Tax=Nostocoides jenkinsii Ben 74 TaxID=1193518 RepID=A0A077M879_9MICO